MMPYPSLLVLIKESKKLNIPGEEVKGVVPGLEFLKRFHLRQEIEVGHRVVVVGGGNTAIDVARIILRLGGKPTVLYRRSKEEMPAIEIDRYLKGEEGKGINGEEGVVWFEELNPD